MFSRTFSSSLVFTPQTHPQKIAELETTGKTYFKMLINMDTKPCLIQGIPVSIDVFVVEEEEQPPSTEQTVKKLEDGSATQTVSQSSQSHGTRITEVNSKSVSATGQSEAQGEGADDGEKESEGDWEDYTSDSDTSVQQTQNIPRETTSYCGLSGSLDDRNIFVCSTGVIPLVHGHGRASTESSLGQTILATFMERSKTNEQYLPATDHTLLGKPQYLTFDFQQLKLVERVEGETTDAPTNCTPKTAGVCKGCHEDRFIGHPQLYSFCTKKQQQTKEQRNREKLNRRTSTKR